MKLLDLFVLVLYFILLIVVGVIMKKKIKTNDDAILAGKSLNIWTGAIGKAANLCGGSTTVGGASYGYSLGITGAWFGIGTALASLALTPFAGRIKRVGDGLKFTTLGDFLQYRFGRTARVIAGGINAIAYLGCVASQVVATGVILAILTGWSTHFSMVISTAVVMLYSLLGGLYAVVYTDIMQIVIIYIGIVFIALPLGLDKVGGFGNLIAQLPAQMTDFMALGWPKIGSMLLATVLVCLVLQAGYTYTIATKNPQIARDSNWLSTIIYIVPAFAAIVIGLVAFVLFPKINSNLAMGTFITSVLPSGLAGLLLAAVIASTMSTSSTCAMMSTTCIMQDFYKEFINPKADGKQMLTMTRIILAVVIALSLIIGIFFSDIIGLILWAYSIAIGALLAPAMACLYWKRASGKAAVPAMLVGLAVQLLLTIINFSVPAIYISTPISAAIMIIGSLMATPDNQEHTDTFFKIAENCQRRFEFAGFRRLKNAGKQR